MNLQAKFYPHAAALATLLALAACSNNDSSPTGGGTTTDTTAPSVTNVSAVDNSHINITFSEAVSRTSAENKSYYSIVERATPSPAPKHGATAPGDPLYLGGASLGTDEKTVTLSTEFMGAVGYTVTVSGVTDVHGNGVKTPIDKPFTGSSVEDATAPEIVYRSPAPGATGVNVGAPLEITFSESVGSITLTLSSAPSGDAVEITIHRNFDGVHFTVQPTSLLELDTEYAVLLSGAKDAASNTMADATWSFTTTNTADMTPPTLVATSPSNNAVNVDVNTNLSLTFSEAMDQNLFDVKLTPDAGDGVAMWSNGGKTVTFDPNEPLVDDTQYSLTILPGGVRDLVGNANNGAAYIVFSTGSALESGSIAGVVSGDLNSTDSKDPSGALIAATFNDFTQGGDPDIAAISIVAGNNSYTIPHLFDGTYYLLCVFDSNHDGTPDTDLGDAIGGYGIDIPGNDREPSTVVINGGSHATGINFPLFDPSAVAGTAHYFGSVDSLALALYVGLFDVTGFDPATSQSVAYTQTSISMGTDASFIISPDSPIPNGDYYLGAYMDTDGNGHYDPAIDPAGLYGGQPPTAIHIADGSDALDKVITLQDPATSMTATARGVSWNVTRHSPAWLGKLSAAIREHQAAGMK